MKYKKIKGHAMTVVFDGHKSGMGTENTEIRGGVRIIYSRLGECADDVIKRIISRERREWLVVSSDRSIANHAWSVDSIPVPSDRFFDIISRQVCKSPYEEAPGPEGESYKDMCDDDEGFEDRRKGNPFQLSKKEKAVRKALGKL